MEKNLQPKNKFLSKSQLTFFIKEISEMKIDTISVSISFGNILEANNLDEDKLKFIFSEYPDDLFYTINDGNLKIILKGSIINIINFLATNKNYFTFGQ